MVVSRAVRLRECLLGELPLYSLKNVPVFLTFAFPSVVAGHKGMFIPADIVKPLYNGHIMIIIHGKIRIIWKKIKFFFFQVSSRNCKCCVYNCDDPLSYNYSPRSSHIWFSFIHNFIIILSRFCNEPTQRPAPSWLVSSVGRVLHRYRRGQWFESRKSLNFFQSFQV